MLTKDGIEIYQGVGSLWYWRLRVKGRIKADGSEGYSRERDVRRALRPMGWQIMVSKVRVVAPTRNEGAKI